MAEAILMPKSGISVESCIIGVWRKQVGDSVSIGEILFDYETDKATFECESTAEGTLLAVFYETGSEVEVLKPVCAVGQEGEDVSALRAEPADDGAGSGDGREDASDVSGDGMSIAGGDASGDSASDRSASNTRTEADRISSAQGTQGAESEHPARGAESDHGGRRTDHDGVGVSPRARHLAEKLGVSSADASPTGPRGRVIERDVERLYGERRREETSAERKRPASAGSTGSAGSSEAAGSTGSTAWTISAGQVSGAAAPPPPGSLAESAKSLEYADEPMPRIRRVIAANMAASLQNLAQLTHHHAFDASQLMKLRRAFKEHGGARGLDGVSIGDMILFAVSRTLPDFPYMNSLLLEGDIIRRYREVHLGVAVDTPRGLMVPVIFNANRKSLHQISDEVKSLATAAREGNINPDLLQGATFTVSNLGPTGVEIFTPIINPPQVGILGVCGSVTRVKTGAKGPITYPSIGLSLTYDHRAVDGAPASRFAGQLAKNLEAFLLLLADR